MKINKKRWAWIAAGCVALAALGWAFSPRPVEVEVAVAAKGRFEQAIEEDGQTRLKDRYTISAPVAARLARITLREGDAVAAGDSVAVLTPVMSSMVATHPPSASGLLTAMKERPSEHCMML